METADVVDMSNLPCQWDGHWIILVVDQEAAGVTIDRRSLRGSELGDGWMVEGPRWASGNDRIKCSVAVAVFRLTMSHRCRRLELLLP